MCECVLLKDVYAGLRIEDMPQLADCAEEIKTDYSKWETLYKCKVCGQLWMEKYVNKGHGEVPEICKIDSLH